MEEKDEKLELELKEEDKDTLFSRWEMEAELRNEDLANNPPSPSKLGLGELWHRNKPKLDQIAAEIRQLRLNGASLYEIHEYRKRRQRELGVEGL